MQVSRPWVVAVLLVALAAWAPPAVANAEDRTWLDGQARAVMSMSYTDFITFKASDRARGLPFDYSSDGCTSTPGGLKQIFDQPCQFHDFGYRNFGNGLRLGRDDTTRRWIDDRFFEEMKRLCGDENPGWNYQGNRTVCNYQAEVIYGRVLGFGRDAFFGT